MADTILISEPGRSPTVAQSQPLLSGLKRYSRSFTLQDTIASSVSVN